MNPALKRIPKFGLLNRLYYAYCGGAHVAERGELHHQLQSRGLKIKARGYRIRRAWSWRQALSETARIEFHVNG